MRLTTDYEKRSLISMKIIIEFYKKLLLFDNFYNILLHNSEQDLKEFIQYSRFLAGIEKLPDPLKSKKNNKVDVGDYRIDVPVWFGDIKKAKKRIIVFGLEPRDTDPNFNIEKIGNKVFAAPFGIDRWNEFSTVKRKPQNKYFRVFKDLIYEEDNFVLFSDIVKDYQKISDKNLYGINNLNARSIFFTKAQKEPKNFN
jgi:hypothetical protein